MKKSTRGPATNLISRWKVRVESGEEYIRAIQREWEENLGTIFHRAPLGSSRGGVRQNNRYTLVRFVGF